MDKNSELQEIARQLRELSARLEALIESEPAEEVAKVATEATPERPLMPLSLNDRYRFQREIFGGSAELLNAALEALAPMTSPGEVEDYFAARDFDLEAEAVKDFLRLATRRFDAHPPLIV
ncbi:MAG: hypothetical protein K2N10_05955 [Muribaculaceae bacterium]|nr:hypothetical protein [Muribaculaceae bacterium]